jgi:hypothetical protein
MPCVLAHGPAAAQRRESISGEIRVTSDRLRPRLDSAMEKAGANVRRIGPDIPRGSPDEVWLEIVGKNNWIALMRDQKIRRRRLETEALKVHGVAAFAFTGGQESSKRHRRFVRCSSSSQT